MEAGEYDPNDLTKPLHKCDFYKSKVAGSKFRYVQTFNLALKTFAH